MPVRGSTNYVWFTEEILGSGSSGNVYLGRHKVCLLYFYDVCFEVRVNWNALVLIFCLKICINVSNVFVSCYANCKCNIDYTMHVLVEDLANLNNINEETLPLKNVGAYAPQKSGAQFAF